MRPCFSSSCLGSLLAGVLCGLLSGCAIGSSSAPTADPGLEIQGKVQGGQQPIVGAHVYLLAANTTGYGSASLSLLTAGTGRTQDTSGGPTNGFYYVTTDGNGDFSISGDYSCTAGTQVYAYSLSGNPGAGTNTAAGLMAACEDAAATKSSAAMMARAIPFCAAPSPCCPKRIAITVFPRKA